MTDLPDKFYLTFNNPPFLFMKPFAAYDFIFDLQHQTSDGVVRTIRGHKCATVADLHNEVAAALQFPGYYGENWGAMDECLTDLEWLPGSWYLLHLCRVEAVLPNDDENFEYFLSVLLYASRVWADPSYARMSDDRRRPFNILISDEEKDVARAKRILEKLYQQP